VGLGVAGLLAGLLEDSLLPETGALRTTLLLGAVTSLASILLYRGIRPAAVHEPHGDDPDRAARRAARRRRILQGAGVRRMFRVLAPRRWHLWWRLALPHGLVGLGAGLTIPFINLYFTDRFGLPKTWLGIVMGASQLTMTVAILGMPRMVRRMGLLKATILTELLSLPFFVTLAFTTNLVVGVAAFVLRTALMNLSHPLWRNLIMEITPLRWRAAVNGVTMLAWNLGWAFSNRVGGALVETSGDWLGRGVDGYAVPMLLTSSAYVVAIVLEAVFFWRVRELGREAPPAPALAPVAVSPPPASATPPGAD
jgi:MFS family permease